MKKTMTFLLAAMALMCFACSGTASGEAPFSLQGVSFGMSREEAKSILGEKYQLGAERENALFYEPVSFSKYSGGMFICILHGDAVVAMEYVLENEPKAYTYLQGALTAKYGEVSNHMEEYIERCAGIGMYDTGITEETALFWKSGDILIYLGKTGKGDGCYIFYFGEIPVTEYNTDGL